MWKKRNDFTTIEDVVKNNVGGDLSVLMGADKKEYHINGLEEASKMILKTIEKKQHIHVVADYDVDGICSAAIMNMLLTEIGCKDFTIRLPKRFSEGYGLSPKIVEEIGEDDVLLITVDNGITAHEAINLAKKKGFNVIVLDHHLPNDDGLPKADLIIDPNAIDNSATFNGYCGAGLAYKLASLMLSGNPVITKLIGLAAIATVADVMPLTEDNRNIVKEGLDAITTFSGRTSGLAALLETCNLDRVVTAKNVGFKIGPILNAPGRMIDDGATMSYELLIFNGSFSKAKEMAERLDTINEERKDAKTKGLEILEKNIQDNCLFGDAPLCIYEPTLKEGLLGIYAGALAEKYQVPCIVFADSEEPGILKGSGRSYGGVNLKGLLDQNKDILHRYGGHEEAVGVAVKSDNYSEMTMLLSESLTMPPLDNDIYYDIDINGDQIADAILELGKYAPFGQGNPEIVFKVSNFKLSPGATGFYKLLGNEKQHIKLISDNCSAIGFSMAENYKKAGTPKIVNLIGTLSQNYFMGRFYNQIEMTDFADARESKKTAMATLLAKAASERR